MKPRILPSEFMGWQTLRASWVSCLAITFLALGVSAPARSQQPSHPAESIADAARTVRDQKPNSTNHPKVITNDDLAAQNSAPSASEPPPVSLSIAIKRADARKSQAAGCDNPDAEKLKAELQAAEEERDQIRRELSDQPTVISNGDLDLTNFKPSYSGLNVGAQPLLQTQPEPPARVAEVILEEKISSLKKSLTIACDSPKDAGIQKQLDQAEQELHLFQQEFALDQDAYYSKPNYAEDAAGKAKLDDEQQRIQDLESELQRLKDKLAAPKTN